MSEASTTQQSLLLEVEALIAALMGDALPAEVTSLTGALETALDQGNGFPEGVADEVRNAVKLVREARPCAAVNALLCARTVLGAPPP